MARPLQVTLSGKNFQLSAPPVSKLGTVVQIDHGTEFAAGLEAAAGGNGGASPTIPAISSTDKITSDPALTGSGDPNTIVHFTIDGTPIAANRKRPTPKGFLGATRLRDLADGVHTIMASQTDAAGQIPVQPL